MPFTNLLKRRLSRAFLRPSHHYIPCRKEELLVRTPSGTVQLWREYSQPGTPAGIVFLRFLGSRGRAEMATLDPGDRLDDLASEVWTVNPPGFGATTGPAELERYADCALAAIDYVHAYAPGAGVWLCGKSIGSAAALLAATHGGVSGVIVRNVMPLRQLLTRHYGWRTGGISWALAAAVPHRLDCIVNARKARAPALFLMSRGDRVSPPPYQRDVIDAYGGPVTILEVEGRHDDRQLAAADETAYRQALRRMMRA